MRIGAIVLATSQGLGYLAKDFYDNGLIDEVYVYPHSKRKNHYEWYPNRVESIGELMDKSDAFIFFETMFNWRVIPEARSKGKKTALMPMYECTPNPLPYIPDIIINPSDLDQKYYPDGIRLNVPVPTWVKPRIREKALHFVHNAGNGGLGGRNGTEELLQAMQYVKSPIKLTIRSQANQYKSNDPRVEIINTSVDKENLYDGDVFIFPEKFNGLSLPIQEAYASGMAIMCGARFPMTEWLPNELMIPIKSYRTEQINTKFDYAEYDPKQIAETIDKWYNQDITKFSEMGIAWGKENSWDNLLTKYRELYD